MADPLDLTNQLTTSAARDMFEDTTPEAVRAVLGIGIGSSNQGMTIARTGVSSVTGDIDLTTIIPGANIGSVVVAAGDVVVVMGQTVAAERGIYVVQASGPPVRHPDFDATGDIKIGQTVAFSEGGLAQRTYSVSAMSAIPWVPGSTSTTWVRSLATTTFPTGVVVGTTEVQTLTGKTLTAPTISDPGITGTLLGFYGATKATKPAVTGSRGGNAALASLLTALATLGLITDSSTA